MSKKQVELDEYLLISPDLQGYMVIVKAKGKDPVVEVFESLDEIIEMLIITRDSQDNSRTSNS